MSTAASSATDTSTSPVTWGGSQPSGGVSSSLYLFTFLITIVVLALISGGLLLRAYYVRRQFQRRVEEAIRAGLPLPADASAALGIRTGGPNRKKEKKHGPMPGIWEAEMHREEEKGAMDRSEKAEWDDIVPLSVTHEAPPPAPPTPVDPTTLMPQRRGPRILRPFLSPRMPDLAAYAAQHPPPGLQRTVTGVTLPPVEPVWTIPYDGEDVTIGVLIAMPVEGREAESWVREDEADEGEVPHVCLGVMASSVKGW